MIDTPTTLTPRRPRWHERLHAGVPLVVLAVMLAALAILCISLISSARAYVGGESQWSRSQKEAALALLSYAETGDPADWRHYQQAMAVPLGDRRAREALERPQLDRAVVRDGFVAGGNHADDVAGMIRLFRWFRQVPFMDRAIAIWAEADTVLADLAQAADALHEAVQRGADAATLRALKLDVLAIDASLTPLEERFSQTLGEAARTTQALLSTAVVVLALLLTSLAVLAMRHTQRRSAEQAAALRESEARRTRALIGSSDGFWEWDLPRRRAYYSPRFERLLGHDPGTLAPDVDSVQALVHPDDKPAARAALKAHLMQAAPYDIELRMKHRDGGWRWMRSRALSDRGPKGHDLRLSGSISDITERRAAEEALRRSEVMFRSLWETTSDAVLIIDTRHRIGYANASAHRTFGHPAGTLVGQPLAVLQPQRMQAAHAAGAERYLRSGDRHLDWRASEVVGRHADGHELPLEICFSEFELDGRHHFVGFLRDITQRKQAEQALRDANERLEVRVQERTSELTLANERLREVDRLKSEFLATMSHELRTPLNAVLGFSDILLEGRPGPLTAEQRRQLGFVRGAGQHLLGLINGLLDVSRIESGRVEMTNEPFDLVAVVNEVASQLQPMADKQGLVLVRDTPSALPLTGDRRKTYQVLLNLTNNALKFTPSGTVRIEATAAADHVCVQVHDSGIGIDAAGLERLFLPFSQVDSSLGRSHEGTGLGLYLSRRLLRLMGGDVQVLSTPGEGSCFSFTLPLTPPPADSVPA